jgi:hypothetical protein
MVDASIMHPMTTGKAWEGVSIKVLGDDADVPVRKHTGLHHQRVPQP